MDLCDKSSWLGKRSRNDVNSFVPDCSMYKKSQNFPKDKNSASIKPVMISDIYFFSAMSPKVMIHGAIIGLNSRTLNENLLILLIWILFGAKQLFNRSNRVTLQFIYRQNSPKKREFDYLNRINLKRRPKCKFDILLLFTIH